jgi:hypothetical protein
MLEAGGACVHVHATTHQGVETDAVLSHPRPPRAAITELIESYLGSGTQKGKAFPSPDKANREDEVYQLPVSPVHSASRFQETSWNAPVIKSWQASSRSPPRLLTCSGNAATRSKLIFVGCCTTPTRAASLPLQTADIENVAYLVLSL